MSNRDGPFYRKKYDESFYGEYPNKGFRYSDEDEHEEDYQNPSKKHFNLKIKHPNKNEVFPFERHAKTLPPLSSRQSLNQIKILPKISNFYEFSEGAYVFNNHKVFSNMLKKLSGEKNIEEEKVFSYLMKKHIALVKNEVTFNTGNAAKINPNDSNDSVFDDKFFFKTSKGGVFICSEWRNVSDKSDEKIYTFFEHYNVSLGFGQMEDTSKNPWASGRKPVLSQSKQAFPIEESIKKMKNCIFERIFDEADERVVAFLESYGGISETLTNGEIRVQVEFLVNPFQEITTIGRGMLGKYGPNNAVDCLISYNDEYIMLLVNPTLYLQMPGGMMECSNEKYVPRTNEITMNKKSSFIILASKFFDFNINDYDNILKYSKYLTYFKELYEEWLSVIEPVGGKSNLFDQNFHDFYGDSKIISKKILKKILNENDIKIYDDIGEIIEKISTINDFHTIFLEIVICFSIKKMVFDEKVIGENPLFSCVVDDSRNTCCSFMVTHVMYGSLKKEHFDWLKNMSDIFKGIFIYSLKSRGLIDIESQVVSFNNVKNVMNPIKTIKGYLEDIGGYKGLSKNGESIGHVFVKTSDIIKYGDGHAMRIYECDDNGEFKINEKSKVDYGVFRANHIQILKNALTLRLKENS